MTFSKIKKFNSISPKELLAVERFLKSDSPLSGFYGSNRPEFFGGKQIRKFEENWNKKFNTEYSVSMNSATSCLIASMGAIDLKSGDEVIVSPFSMSISAIAPIFYGAVPIFCDIEEDFFNIDYEDVVRKTTSRTKAIIVVNQFGHPAELERLKIFCKKKGIYLIEDNSQSILAHENNKLCGTVGDIGVFSLNIHKHIHCGEGGVCITSNKELASRLSLIRNHGENVVDSLNLKNNSNILGFNFRLPEISATIANEQLKRVDFLTKRTEDIGSYLSQELLDVENLIVPKVRKNCRHVYFMWSCKVKNTSKKSLHKFCSLIQKKGILITQGYVKPIYKLSIFNENLDFGCNDKMKLYRSYYENLTCEVVERIHNDEIIQFQPVSWDIKLRDIKIMARQIKDIFNQTINK